MERAVGRVNFIDGQHSIELNRLYSGENPFLWSHLLVNEALHPGSPVVGRYEETAIQSLDSLVYLQQLSAHPELALGGALSRLRNVYALMRLNSGTGAAK